jgi:hypothetical protein
MSSCEKCWQDSAGDDHAARYAELIESRKDRPCTPEEQAGPDAKRCPRCERMTLHQYAGECMAGCDMELS